MKRIRLAIDPELKQKYAPEVCWAWRLLLSSIGLPWEEVPIEAAEYDIAYVTDYGRDYPCRLCVRVNPKYWEKMSDLRMAAVGQCDGWSHPIYEGEQRVPQPFQVVDGRLVCERDIVFDVFWLATGQEERHWSRNRHGHFDLRENGFPQVQVPRLALASSIGSGLENTFRDLGFPTPIARWPHGKKAAACIGHDVDYPEVIRWLEPLRILRRQGLRGLPAAASVLGGRRNHWHFDSWVQLERSMNSRSAFYFVAQQGSLQEYAAGTPDPFYDVRSERFKKLFHYLTDAGFEIGLQGSYRAWESPERLLTEKETLEKASGQTICGNRHHYWHLNPDNPESTLLVHEQVGLKYDTSLSHERYLGWRRGLSWPFFPFHQEKRQELKTLQITTAWMDNQLFGYRQDNPGDRLKILRALAHTAAEQGGCLLIDIHDYIFDEVLFPGWVETYRGLWEYVCACSDFWIDSPGAIADHWVKRYTSITRASQGLEKTRYYCA